VSWSGGLSFEIRGEKALRSRPQLALAAVIVCQFLLFVCLTSPARAQQPESKTAQGIELYKQGNHPGAIKILQEVVNNDPDDIDAQYFLGLAYYDSGITGAARAPLERVVEARPKSADVLGRLAYVLILANEPQPATAMAQQAIDWGYQSAAVHYAIAEASLRTRSSSSGTDRLLLALSETEKALAIDPYFPPALLTRSFAYFQLKQYAEAADSFKRLIAVTTDDEEARTWRQQLAYIEQRASEPVTTDATRPPLALTGREVTQKARVLSKPEPQYSDAARMAGVQGTVVIRAIFSADGEVKNLYLLEALPFGLTTNCMQAARRIKFAPATRDGRPVSMYIQFEYNFNLY
jgi:TonB family protein